MENKIPTIEEWCMEWGIRNEIDGSPIHQTAIRELIKLHVKEALKQASENVLLEKDYNYGRFNEATAKFDKGTCKMFYKETSGHGDCGYEAVRPSKDSILNAYPLDLIK